MNSAFFRMLLWTMLLSAITGRFCGLRAYAQDNPFGFPEPIRAQRLGSVMLHGGGNGVREYVRQEFLRLAGGSDARVVLLPSDYEQREPGEKLEAYEERLSRPGAYGRWRELCRGNHAHFQFLYWNCPEDPDNSRFFSALEEATGIWMPAEDQEWVIKRFAGDPLKPTRFQLALRNLLARGGVVGASGGGMASLSETVIAGDTDNENAGWTQARLAFGLGLFQGTLLDQNFNIWSGRVERLTDALRNGPQLDRVARKPGVQHRTIGNWRRSSNRRHCERQHDSSDWGTPCSRIRAKQRRQNHRVAPPCGWRQAARAYNRLRPGARHCAGGESRLPETPSVRLRAGEP